MDGNLFIGFLRGARPATDVVPQLVWSEVSAGEPSSGFESGNLEARGCQGERRHASDRAESDDHNVGLF
jgi:hypothetical protein